ncbi:hypothetical protein [Roseateles flavus]|uniref:Uncharacterized protein n=1 Tax=Roseateles flavus TaxID=3149041 RepID=A0ABV0GGD4_9BURK
MDDTKVAMPETIRLLLELDRADDPLLYDDLIRFKKGTKRVTRLRLLAHDGAADRIHVGAGHMQSQSIQSPVTGAQRAPSSVFAPGAADVFLEPITDG